MKIMIFLHGTSIMHRSAVRRTREERVRQSTEGSDLTLREFASYVPVGHANEKVTAWKKQGAEIIYLISQNQAIEVIDEKVLRRYGFPEGPVLFRRQGESYADIAERVQPDVLVEDDCESIGGAEEMTYTHIKPEFKARVKSIVVREFEGIDHLPDDINQLAHYNE